MKQALTLLSVMIVAFSVGFALRAAEETSTEDSSFLQSFADLSRQQRELGKLARQRAFRTDIRDYGKTLAKDHKDMEETVQQLANNQGLLVAVKPEPGEHSSAWDRISKLGGDEFDRAILEQAVADHELAIRVLNEESKSGQNSKIKTFASEALASEKLHLERAQSLQRGPAVPESTQKTQFERPANPQTR